MIQTIPYAQLALAFIPVFLVIAIIGKWNLGYKGSLYAVARMLIQLLLIGYALTFIFQTENAWIVLAVLTIMLASASWIALRTIHIPRTTLYLKSLGAIFLGGGTTLILMSQAVLNLAPWYLPRYLIMVMCMIFGASGISAALFLTWIRPHLSK